MYIYSSFTQNYISIKIRRKIRKIYFIFYRFWQSAGAYRWSWCKIKSILLITLQWRSKLGVFIKESNKWQSSVYFNMYILICICSNRFALYFRDEAVSLASKLKVRLYRTSVKEDLNVSNGVCFSFCLI